MPTDTITSNQLQSIEVHANNPYYTSVDGILYNKELTTLISCPTNRTSLSLPKTVTTIADYAFFQCTKLTLDTLPTTITYIAPYAFYGCDSITRFLIPDSVQELVEYAFANCDNLSEIHMSKQITSIANNAFENCTTLKQVLFQIGRAHV